MRGLSLLGGEPFAPENQAAVLAFVRQVREKFPLKDIWCWTGYLYEELAARQDRRAQSRAVDSAGCPGGWALHHGAEGYHPSIPRGSTNQRVLNVQSSISSGEPVLMLGY